jgi:hypothetical protein
MENNSSKNFNPKPVISKPSMEELEEMVWEGIAEATDGCTVEPDGTCPHGHKSWLIYFGMI